MTRLSRRTALFTAAAATVAATLRVRPARAQAAGPYSLPPLPYGFDANEPHIDAQTMMIHHDRHHAAYVANLNAAVKDYPQLAAMSPDALVARLADIPEQVRTAIRNNGGGHVNHSMFWQIMGGKGGAPAGALADAINRDFGGFEALKTQFNRTGAGVFGSGWVFVTVTREGKLALAPRPNQDTPLMDGGRVLFGNDVWEHAYYLKYQNRRPDYLAAWWNVLDWTKVAARYDQAKAGTLTI
ncbi:superoxide dismutase [Limobrevibacterium gyesilva]|uniref:Superoxide dismutase n=1 Tax=Limobrevibacterium gyesilva TaxID=2991712 RepID=A0AA41YRH2_9PROT|nr:superoxide dismutase [Limobrevibacterium gyesilva]MCW3477495.1 superoxide dismutase [Limobrevibacterium gyesilva]